MRVQPVRRPRPQLVEMIHDVEHAPIKPWGYDTYDRFAVSVTSRT